MTSLIFDRATLARALDHLARTVERRNTIPVLGHVRMIATADETRLTATDLDIELTAVLPPPQGFLGREAVSFCLPAHLLRDVVGKIVSSELALRPDGSGGRVSVTGGRARFQMASLPSEDFPDLAAGEFGHSFSLSAEALTQLLSPVRFAISTEQTRYYLNGVYLHEREGQLCAVATDGHRLARKTRELPERAAGFPGVIIPRKTVGEIIELAKAEKGEARIEISTGKLRVSFGGTTLTSKLIDGTFPDYERVIPKAGAFSTKLPRGETEAAVARVLTVAEEKSRGVKFSFGSGLLKLAVSHPEQSAEDDVPLDWPHPPLEIGFNGRYLSDILASLPGKSVDITLTDAGSPALLEDKDVEALTIVLMPLRVA